MKKVFLALFALLCLVLSACAAPNPPATREQTGFSPLFRFQVPEETQNQTQMFALPRSQGFFYLHAGAQGGFTGGFVSPSRSLSSEKILEGSGKIDGIRVLETTEDRALIWTGDGIFASHLSAGGSQRFALPEDLTVLDARFYDDLSLMAETPDWILLLPLDFSQKFVLAKKDLLPDFAGLITAHSASGRIWYATGEPGAYTGLAFFEYGKGLPLGREAFAFQSFVPVSPTAVLFTTKTSQGVSYTYRDFASGHVASITVPQAFEGVSCNAGGTVLCGSRAMGDGGQIEIYDLSRGEKKGVYESAYGIPCPGFALDETGETLFFAVGMGKDQVLGTLNLKKYTQS